MATDLTVKATSAIDWTFLDEGLALSTPQDKQLLKFLINLANGIGANQADLIYHDSSIAEHAAVDLDLDAAAGTPLIDAFGQEITFVKVKVIAIRNLSSTPGENLAVGGDANALMNWVNAAADIVNIGPGGWLIVTSPIDGYGVTAATGDILQIDPGTDDIAYDVVLIGCSGGI